MELLGVVVTSEGTTAALTGLRTAEWANQYGSLHGGIWACGAELLASRLLGGGEEALRTTHIHVAFLRPGGTSMLELHARLVHRGRTLGLVDVEGLDDDGKTCVRATVIGQA